MMRTKAMKPSSPPAEDDASASKVLGNDGLLGEILVRLNSPTCLVRAALVRKLWLRGASDRAFLRRFGARHPPRLLGFYVSSDGIPRPEFVPMPQAHGPELGAALRRADFGFGDVAEFSSDVWDCQNGRVLYEFAESFNLSRAPAVRAPLRCPGRGQDMAVLPPQPPTWPECPHAMLLPEDSEDDASCYRVDIDHLGRNVSAQVHVLRSDAWTLHCSALAELARAPDTIPMITLLAGGKLYMVTEAGYILGLNLSTASFFLVELPEGVAYEYYGNLVPCRGHGSALYLFHVKGDKLTVRLSRMGGDHGGARAGEWVLRDTISLRETCGHLVEKCWEPADGHEAIASVVGVGDNAEFVFVEFEVIGVVVYMHLGSRKVEKVYQRDPENDHIIRVLPFMAVLSLVFPALDADEGEEGHQE